MVTTKRKCNNGCSVEYLYACHAKYATVPIIVRLKITTLTNTMETGRNSSIS